MILFIFVKEKAGKLLSSVEKFLILDWIRTTHKALTEIIEFDKTHAFQSKIYDSTNILNCSQSRKS